MDPDLTYQRLELLAVCMAAPLVVWGAWQWMKWTIRRRGGR